MLDSILSSGSANLLERGLSGASLRQKVISNNIANVDTPGFKRSDVSFERQLQQAMGQTNILPLMRTNDSHLSNIEDSDQPLVTVERNTSMRLDGNNVDVDKEMAALAKNTIYYNAVATQLSKTYSMLVSAIKEGK